MSDGRHGEEREKLPERVGASPAEEWNLYPEQPRVTITATPGAEKPGHEPPPSGLRALLCRVGRVRLRWRREMLAARARMLARKDGGSVTHMGVSRTVGEIAAVLGVRAAAVEAAKKPRSALSASSILCGLSPEEELRDFLFMEMLRAEFEARGTGGEGGGG